jgi:hypothetical protein
MSAHRQMIAPDMPKWEAGYEGGWFLHALLMPGAFGGEVEAQSGVVAQVADRLGWDE